MRPITDFAQVLAEATNQCDSFSLLWRRERKEGEGGWEIQEALRPFMLRCEQTDQWPGTKIFYGKELVCFYQVNAASMQLLSTAKNPFILFGRGGPEDLAFYSNGAVWFGSTSHENQAWYET